MTEQRYRAVQAVVADGRTVTEVASEWRVSRQTLHTWLARYEADGLDGLGDRSHRLLRQDFTAQGASEVETAPVAMADRARRTDLPPRAGPRKRLAHFPCSTNPAGAHAGGHTSGEPQQEGTGPSGFVAG